MSKLLDRAVKKSGSGLSDSTLSPYNDSNRFNSRPTSAFLFPRETLGENR